MVKENTSEPVELCAIHCRHTDCIYRSSIEGGKTPICFYAAIAEHSRGCKISECDKYRSGEKLKPHFDENLWIWWECDIDDGKDADTLWNRFLRPRLQELE